MARSMDPAKKAALEKSEKDGIPDWRLRRDHIRFDPVFYDGEPTTRKCLGRDDIMLDVDREEEAKALCDGCPHFLRCEEFATQEEGGLVGWIAGVWRGTAHRKCKLCSQRHLPDHGCSVLQSVDKFFTRG